MQARQNEPHGGGSLRLGEGWEVAYGDCGDPAGAPTLFFHGGSGNRVFPFFDEWGRELGLRFLTPERPGYGVTPFRRDHRILGWAAVVAALADHLALERFTVAGVSAGGPYTLATAFALPDRVERAIVISGIAPPEAPGGYAGMAKGPRASVVLARRAPWLLTAMTNMAMRAVRKKPDRFHDRSMRSMPAADRAVAGRPEVRVYLQQQMVAAVGAGARGPTHELRLSTQPWGFELDQIRVPVDVWHGEAEVTVPLRHAEWVVERVPGARLHVVPGGGHLILFDHWREMFARPGG